MLARLFRAHTDSPLSCEPLAEDFFQKANLDPLEGWAGLLAVWDKVQYPDGQNVFTVSVARAKARSMHFYPSPGIRLAAIATAAYHLSVAANGEPFMFPVKCVAEAFDIPVSTAIYAVTALVKAKVLANVDPNFSYAEGKAKTFRFVAVSLDEETGN